MTYEEISYLVFEHLKKCVVTQQELSEFVDEYWLSQYPDGNTYKKDNRIFASYKVGDKLEVYVCDKKLLPKTIF